MGAHLMARDEYTQHTVEPGEDLVSIAVDYRMDADTIWNDPKNRDIRQKKADDWRQKLGSIAESPYVLQPGDLLWIPPWQPKKVSIETDKKHTFRLKGVPEKFILYLKRNDDPRAGVEYTLEIKESKTTYSGKTDSTGKIEHWVQPKDRHAKLTLKPPPDPGSDSGPGSPPPEPEVYEVLLGRLDPVSTPEGLRDRLFNLGFLSDREPADEDLESAIRTFQKHYGLKETGEANSETLEKLVAAHKS
jgi:N-acetylmuramoyl-L-alanine amidase